MKFLGKKYHSHFLVLCMRNILTYYSPLFMGCLECFFSSFEKLNTLYNLYTKFSFKNFAITSTSSFLKNANCACFGSLVNKFL